MKVLNYVILGLFTAFSVGCNKIDGPQPKLESTNSNKGKLKVQSQPVASVTVKVTTYNILSKNHDGTFPNNMWVDRKDALKDIIKQANNVPEILGIQEGQNIDQVDALILRMGSGYDHYVSPKTISPRAIFWKNDKYELVASDTKDLISPSITGYSTQRYASYVRLRHISTGKLLIVFNVHLPLGSEVAKQQLRYDMASFLAGKVQQYSGDYGDIPIIVMGDFNSYYSTVINGVPSAPATLVSYGLSDTYAACASSNRLNADYRTKNDMVNAKAQTGANGSKRLDYILTYPSANVSVLDWRNIINFSSGSTVNMQTPVPSDHNPVRSRLTLNWYN